MFLNTWSVRVALHSVSSRSHSLSDSSRLFKMMCNSLSVSKLLEYRRKSALCYARTVTCYVNYFTLVI